jgi:hypothetical protein
MREAMAKNLHAGKTLGWAGATPNLTAFSRPKFFGVAPARIEPLDAVFCPRAYGEAIEPESKTQTILNTKRSEPAWQF